MADKLQLIEEFLAKQVEELDELANKASQSSDRNAERRATAKLLEAERIQRGVLKIINEDN